MMKLCYPVIFFLLIFQLAGCKTAQTEECKEIVKENCMCTRQYDPVCGCNKKTYGNACEAECHGITNYTKGECPEAK
jgi:hypothetical protein